MNKKLLFILLTVTIYLTGVLSGILVGRFLIASRGFMPPLPADAHRRGRPPEQMMNRFAKQLNLTDVQKSQIVRILENNKSTIDTYRNEFHANMKKTIDAVNMNIRSILTDEQKIKFDTIIKEGPGHRGMPEGPGQDRDFGPHGPDHEGYPGQEGHPLPPR